MAGRPRIGTDRRAAISITIDAEVLGLLRTHAESTGVSLSAAIEQALRRNLGI